MMPPTTYINLMDIMTIMVGFYNSAKGWLEIKLTLELLLNSLLERLFFAKQV